MINIEKQPYIRCDLNNRIIVEPTYTPNTFSVFVNFELTEGIMKVIEEMTGVEEAPCLSRYSFVLKIGKAFNAVDIRYIVVEKIMLTLRENKGNK